MGAVQFLDRINIYFMKRSEFLIYADEAIKCHEATYFNENDDMIKEKE